MRLNQLPKGPNRPRKRVGKGEGSGHGKTSGRGQKGQKSRSGYSQRPGFESGHVPLYRRLPRRGFNNKNFRTEYAVVNLGDLARVEADAIDPATLEAAGLIRAGSARVKILGDGELDRALTIHAHKFSSSAVKKIEGAGGTVITLEAESPEAQAEESDSSGSESS